MHYLFKTLVVLSITIVSIIGEDINDPTCNCAVFEAPAEETTTKEPILSKAPNFKIDCNDAGKQTCAKMCIALAEAAKDSAPTVLCNIVGKTEHPFTPVVFYKACGDKMWQNTGLTSKIRVCCSDKHPTDCDVK